MVYEFTKICDDSIEKIVTMESMIEHLFILNKIDLLLLYK